MKQETHIPYRKPNSNPIYIHKQLNHPQNILGDLPKSTSKRISDTFSKEEIFNDHIPIYQQVICQADVTNDVDDEYKFYYSLTESSFKKRFKNHTKLFNN